MNMIRTRFLLALALSSTTVFFSICAEAQAEGRIGFVNTERVLRDAVPAQRAQKKIETEFQKRDQELVRLGEQLKKMQDDLEKNGVTMSEAQRKTKERDFNELNTQFQRKQREFREDLNQRRNEELAGC